MHSSHMLRDGARTEAVRDNMGQPMSRQLGENFAQLCRRPELWNPIELLECVYKRIRQTAHRSLRKFRILRFEADKRQYVRRCDSHSWIVGNSEVMQKRASRKLAGLTRGSCPFQPS